MKNDRKHRNNKLVTTGKRRRRISKYHTIKFFTENLLAIEIIKSPVLMKKSVYQGLRLSILDLSKTVMYNS